LYVFILTFFYGLGNLDYLYPTAIYLSDKACVPEHFYQHAQYFLALDNIGVQF